MIHVARIGFTGVGAENYDGPEKALEHILQGLEAKGSTVVSVAVIRSTRNHERYESFITYRSKDAHGEATDAAAAAGPVGAERGHPAGVPASGKKKTRHR